MKTLKICLPYVLATTVAALTIQDELILKTTQVVIAYFMGVHVGQED